MVPGEADLTVMQVIVEGEKAGASVRYVYDRKGISPPEFIGRDEARVDFMLQGLEERGVVYRQSVEEI